MATPNVTFIADVDVLRDDLTLKVRVINLWKHMSFYNKDEIWSIELILLDEQGSKIQATVWKKFLYRFKNILKDGSTFYITSPSFASQKSGCFKITPQDQKLTFVQNTVLKECAEFSGSTFGFSFVDYQTVMSLLHPEDIYVDVIGFVVAITEMMRDDPEKSKHRLTIHIQDANALQLRFAKISVWRDRPSVNTYFTSSKLFINSDIDEISLFKKSLDGDDRPDSSSNTISVIESKQLSELDDFIVITKLKTIAEIFEPHSKTHFIIVGTIKGILQNEKWFYPACTNCSHRAFPDTDAKPTSYECRNQNCTKKTTTVVPRFMIPIRVQDNTGTITLTMFEKEGRVSDNVDLIEQLENKFTESQTGITHSLDVCSGEFESQDNRPLKDQISGTDDNITPSTVDKNSATSPMKFLNTTPVLKRNLEEVFDLELNENLSSSKTKKVSLDGPRKQLLEVKLEKSG
ncbi:unnamed protein product [Lactuca saligna]|uniref:Replication factor A C-terminal domain-containing protein n=1 Tax=Lactuca saligna TaxID=75948 RepID=A0AA35ZRT7_LACSI|nr:unnamed protein product [Lactuca saligna]